MPETAKVNRPEEASCKTDEPGIGAKKTTRHHFESAVGAWDAPVSAKTGPQSPQTSHEPQFDGQEQAGIPEKRSTAEAAGFGGAPEARVKGEPNEGQDTSGPRSERESFSGWDRLDDIHDLSAEDLVDQDEPAQSHEDEAGPYSTLSEIALASRAYEALDGSSDTGSGHSSKHEELAEAVQAALLSVYGGAPLSVADMSAPDRKALPFPPEQSASGSAWASEDNMSPQDVILNYFDYQPGPGKGRRDYLDARDGGDRSGVLGDPQDYASQRYRPHWPGPAAHDDYDDLAAYPEESHGGHPEPVEETERESNRLLSAAAIGLVGGIAIAASLAVFVINSYGPSARQMTGMMSETGETGYGRWGKGNAEPQPEVPPVISASDVPAIPGQPSPLAIEVKPEQANEKRLISITGVPEGARLNAGVDAGGGNWLLPPRRLAGLTINVPAGTSDPVSLGVQVLDGNLRAPLSETKRFTVHVNATQTESAAAASAATPTQTQQDVAVLTPAEPSPAPETPVPSKPAPSFFSTETVQTAAALPANATRQAALRPPAPPSKTEIEDLLREGNKRMREGDILEARQLYQKAVSTGDPEAALAMGRAFDPVYFSRISKKNAEPDAAKAFDWYRKAMDGGAGQTAKLRIENLKHYLNQ